MTVTGAAFAAVWFDLDVVHDYEFSVWGRAVRAAMACVTGRRLPLAVFEGLVDDPWVRQRWSHRRDVEGVVVEVPTRKAARAVVKSLKTGEPIPGLLGLDALGPESTRHRGLVHRAWYTPERVLVSSWHPESELHSDARLPIAYWEEMGELEAMTKRFDRMGDARQALAALPCHGSLPGADDVGDLPLFRHADRESGS